MTNQLLDSIVEYNVIASKKISNERIGLYSIKVKTRDGCYGSLFMGTEDMFTNDTWFQDLIDPRTAKCHIFGERETLEETYPLDSHGIRLIFKTDNIEELINSFPRLGILSELLM